MDATAHRSSGRPLPRSKEDLSKIAQQTVEEARMVLPGIQALFGFQLIAVFNARFTQLSFTDQLLHFSALVLVAIATALIMTPAAYHRQAERGTVSKFFVRMASTIIAIAMVPLMLGLCLDVYILGALITGRVAFGVIVAGTLLAFFAALWFAFPWLAPRWRAMLDDE
jgi:hypothetical protein